MSPSSWLRTDRGITAASLAALALYARSPYTVPAWVPYERSPIAKRDFVAAVATAFALYWLWPAVTAWAVRRRRPTQWFMTDRSALAALAVFVGLLVSWLGLVVFANPYDWTFNHGDGGFNAQVLHWFSEGRGPQQTAHYNANPYIASNPYFFASVFSIGQYWLSWLLLVPLYALHPVPPMHVFAMAIVVLAVGSLGVYLAVRAAGGRPRLALTAAACFAVLPQVERDVLFKGNFDVVGLAVVPYAFAGLFTARPLVAGVGALAMAALSLPYTFMTIALGLMVPLFFGTVATGVIVLLIGIAARGIDMAIFHQSLCGIFTGREPPGLFEQFVLNGSPAQLLPAFWFLIGYVLILAISLAGLPVRALRLDRRWNRRVLGLWAFAGVALVMGLFRSYSWEFQRNALLIVPIYLAAWVAVAQMEATGPAAAIPPRASRWTRALVCGVVGFSLWSTWFFPWVGLNHNVHGLTVISAAGYAGRRPASAAALLARTPEADHARTVLDRIEAHVPSNASVAYNVSGGLQAFLDNRLAPSWVIPHEPPGVDFYVIQRTDDHGWSIPWRDRLAMLEQSSAFVKVFDDPGIVIYRNLHPRSVAVPPGITDWSVVSRALLFQGCPRG